MKIAASTAFSKQFCVTLALPVLVVAIQTGCKQNSNDPALYSYSSGPSIVAQPVQSEVNVSECATFTVVATGDAINFQWKRNGNDIPGANNPTYTTRPVTYMDNDSCFTVEVFNSYGSVISNPAYLYVNDTLMPSIILQPCNMAVSPHQHAIFSVIASSGSGSQELYYQWEKNGRKIQSANSSTYRTHSVDWTDNGSIYTVTVYNSYGSITSQPAVLTVSENVNSEGPSIIRFDADDTALYRGQSCKITWNVSNADFINIDHGIGQVQNYGYMYVTPHRTTTYTLTAMNQVAKNIATVTVYVQ